MGEVPTKEWQRWLLRLQKGVDRLQELMVELTAEESMFPKDGNYI